MDVIDKNTKKSVKKGERGDDDGRKKPFDKKKYREQKYSNKYKVNQWEEKRKKAIINGFYKELKKEASKGNIPKNDEIDGADEASGSKRKKPKPLKPFHSARQEYIRKKMEKQRKKDEFLKVKLEREEALRKYKQRKMQTYKELSKKTKKGQPVMKGRIELLLEKIKQDDWK